MLIPTLGHCDLYLDEHLMLTSLFWNLSHVLGKNQRHCGWNVKSNFFDSILACLTVWLWQIVQVALSFWGDGKKTIYCHNLGCPSHQSPPGSWNNISWQSKKNKSFPSITGRGKHSKLYLQCSSQSKGGVWNLFFTAKMENTHPFLLNSQYFPANHINIYPPRN